MTETGVVAARARAEVRARSRGRPGPRPLWLAIVIGALLVLNALPFLAPVFMKLGWEGPARAVYLVYSGLCHQMAQRSFFLFGPQGFQMYNIAELPINVAGLSGGERLLALRHFIGSEAMGWKVAWSDRMVYMYTTPLLLAIGYALLRRRVKIRPLGWRAFFLLLLPMLIDGGTHWISDLAGVGQGFRYANEWLATLTNHALPASFYVGDAFGSFNSLMRLLSGVSFGLSVTGLTLPYLDRAAGAPVPRPADSVAQNTTASRPKEAN